MRPNTAAWLSQLDLRLPLDAFQRPNRQVAVRMGNSDAPDFYRVLKMDVASSLGTVPNRQPAEPQERLDCA
jgi:hypothetical protein